MKEIKLANYIIVNLVSDGAPRDIYKNINVRQAAMMQPK